MAGRYSVEAIFKAVDRITAPVDRMQNSVGRFTRSTEKSFRRLNRSFDKLNSGLKTIAATGAVAFAATGTAMASVVNTGADFQQSIVNAAAKFPGLIDNTDKFTATLGELEAAASKTGKTTEFTATESANALNFLAMAGFNAEKSIAALPTVVDLATASQTDLATATDIATDTMGAFGLESKNATEQARNLTRVSDVLARTSTASNTSMIQLFEAMRKGGPVATATGASIEMVASMIGTMANAGIKADIAGTAVQNAFLNLSNPASKANKLLKRLKVTLEDNNGNLRDMPSIIDDVNKAVQGLGGRQRVAVIESIFGREGLAGTMKVISQGGDALRQFIKLNEDATGTSTKMANVMRNTVRGKLNSLKSAIEGVSISMFTMTKGPLADVIDKTTEWVRANEGVIATKLGEFLLSIATNMEGIIKWVKRIAIGIGIFLALTTILKTFILVMTAVNLVMLANPITLVVLAVLALIAAVTALVIWWDELKASFDSLPAVVQLAIGAIMGPIGVLVAGANLVIQNWEKVKVFFKEMWEGITKSFDQAISSIINQVDRFKQGFNDIKSNLSFGIFGGDDDDDTQSTPSPNVITQSERVERMITENNNNSKAEIMLKADKGTTATVNDGVLPSGVSLIQSGAM